MAAFAPLSMAAFAAFALAAFAAGYGLRAAEPVTPKGYAIAEIAVHDAEGYKVYVAAVTPLVEKFGGKYLVRGGKALDKEGAPVAGRIVVLEFPSLAAANAFYDSPDYQAVLPIRLKTASSRVYDVEGYAPAP